MATPPENAESAAPGMVWVPGGSFVMGSNAHYPEERPAHPRRVDGFWMDRTAVTNAEFARFVAETGYVTTAELPPDAAEAAALAPALRHAGSLVFHKTDGPVPLDDVAQWWRFVPGASWRHPRGPDSDIAGDGALPVVHVSAGDALAYAHWAGKDLPDEAEWEYAARGGCPDDQIWPWGHHLTDDGKPMANTWQGEFPWQDLALDGFAGIAPADSFAPNGYGLFNMIGNVWEWTTDWYSSKHPADAAKACCVPENPRGGPAEASYDPCQPQIQIPRKVLKGGSHLCAPSYCRRYRPAARHAEAVDTTTSHVGFRCIVRHAAGG